ncbi:ABC transporter ATP-binding protein [Bradyrhizobium ottawaense]|uniref:ABC transporter ATP-binding protein n=1 Tax=Bradyrhizobium ottawaense TaxID=931866 RepID=UPI003834E0C5
MSPDIALAAEGLRKEFAGYVALDGVSLQVQRGTIHALIGPNGAGKTTCFNLLTKFHVPTAGRILLNGRDVTDVSAPDVARLGLVRSFQISAIFPELTVLENVRIALQRARGNSFDFWRSSKILSLLNDRANALLADVGLESLGARRAGDLSYGRKRALEIATTLALDPDVLLLDEPTQGMGREDVSRVASLIERVAERRTVLMVEHNLGVVSSICHRVTVLARGRVLAEGDYHSVAGDPEVREAYIGVGHA